MVEEVAIFEDPANEKSMDFIRKAKGVFRGKSKMKKANGLRGLMTIRPAKIGPRFVSSQKEAHMATSKPTTRLRVAV